MHLGTWRRSGFRPARRRVGLCLAMAASLFTAAPAPAAASEPTVLRVVGGLAGVNQYLRHEEPFWTQELPRLSGGRLRADVVPFDRAGIRGADMLRLMQLGVVSFGTVLVSQASGQDPLLGAMDLAGLNPDIASLRRHLAAFRPLLAERLRERHGIELLAVYTYPAQMVFCNKPLVSLTDLSGRKVRTSSPTQADWVEALGGMAVTTPFAEIVQQMRSGGLDCAITGSMSGNTIGLHEVTSHIHTLPITWGLSLFGANRSAWQALPADLRGVLTRELARLEHDIWQESDHETGEGLACNIGAQACVGGRKGRMTEVRATPADVRRQREIFASTVLSRWLQRCGAGCAEAWNRTLGPVNGTLAPR
ncbi:TRAP transporter substrate-binding protein [Ideonella sp. 4Y11]|uniref:TRAP transporter substrate-binding protein n=1 Tax=Ideonella aquatica TaxID=2824119 RepID=A0A941BM60_9BURK|nr:TRAP transporter substrate-binding protein [Ideonella aquatica]MBQ0961678.1 TRAP transporter substrate-binding protein [Ideonella aquatica]